jgi:hypothetical protein
MILNKYGVTLELLSADKIEKVRNWRNDPKISDHMDFRGFITNEMQIAWYNTLDKNTNYYFILI